MTPTPVAGHLADHVAHLAGVVGWRDLTRPASALLPDLAERRGSQEGRHAPGQQVVSPTPRSGWGSPGW
jgi:hypothetical protein